MKKSRPNFFLSSFFGCFALFNLIILFTSFNGIIIRHSLSKQRIYRYQNQKIDLMATDDLNHIETIFVGDSSLGNAIDAYYFTQLSGLKSINLALEGTFGYAGSYNMIKQMTRHKSLQNVVLMHTIDMGQRSIAYDGYLLSINDFSDFLELSFQEKIYVLQIFLKKSMMSSTLVSTVDFHLNPKSFYDFQGFIQNDYVVQRNQIDVEQIDVKQNARILLPYVTPGKDRFLRKIIDLCKEKDLNLIYVHGPIWEDVIQRSSSYMTLYDSFLKTTGINVVSRVISIPDTDIGDADDHVNPAMKKKYTEQYFNLVQDVLRF